MTTYISSLQNPRIREVQRLLEKNRERRRQQLFVAEGRREVSLALQAGYQIEFLLQCNDIYQPDPLYPILADASCVYEISRAVYNKLAYRADSEGIIMLAKTRDHSLESLSLDADPLILIVETVEKPGNLGAILRSCDAAGADALILCDQATDIYNPNVIRSSLGCLFSQKLAIASSSQVVSWLEKKQVKAFAAAPQGSISYDQADYSGPVALVFGSESHGLSEFMMNKLSRKISIPMAGKIDSLNVSVSAAIILFEAVRQRKTMGK